MKMKSVNVLLFLCTAVLYFDALSVQGLSLGFLSRSQRAERRAVADKQKKFHAQHSPTNKKKEPTTTIAFHPPIVAKPRPTVRLNPLTGKLTEVAPAVTESPQQTAEGKWNGFKRVLYGTVDAVSSVSSKIRTKQEPQTPIVAQTYRTMETTILGPTTNSNQSPGQRLMKEYQSRSLPKEDGAVQDSKLNSFDSFKETVYTAAEGVASLWEAEPPSSTTPQETFKPVTRTTVAQSPEVRKALPDVISSNPVTQWSAANKITQWEARQQQQQQTSSSSSRQGVLSTIKERVFGVGDFLQTVSTKMGKAVDATGASVRKLPQTVDAATSTIAQIPNQVDQTMAQATTSVTKSLEQTQTLVQAVQAVPGQIQTSVKNVQALPGNIQRTAQETMKTVDETVTNVKVLVGVEKAQPKPPKTPPPQPRTAEELALDVTGAVVKETAKAAWWVGWGIAKLSWKGARLAAIKAKERLDEEAKERKEAITRTTSSQATTVPEPQMRMDGTSLEVNTKKKVVLSAQEKRDLDGEVSDALKLAQRAIALADEGRSTDGKSDLDRALQKAKAAAITATQEAVEIEKSLNERK